MAVATDGPAARGLRRPRAAARHGGAAHLRARAQVLRGHAGPVARRRGRDPARGAHRRRRPGPASSAGGATGRARAARSRWVFVAAGAPLLALGMAGLFNPPAAGSGGLEWWLVANLVLVYTAFSLVTVSYQAHGAEISDDVSERTRVTAWREGFALVGVFLAAALPEVLRQSIGRAGGLRALRPALRAARPGGRLAHDPRLAARPPAPAARGHRGLRGVQRSRSPTRPSGACSWSSC